MENREVQTQDRLLSIMISLSDVHPADASETRHIDFNIEIIGLI